MCVEGRFSFPLSALTEEQIDNFKTTLTYKSAFANDEGEYKTITLYEVDDTHIHLPIEWAKLNYPNLYQMATDARVAPGKLEAKRLPDPNHPRVRDPAAQAAFMADMLATVQEHGNALCYAATGSGKTVTALYVAAKLGVRTLVLVDKEQLRDQWIKEGMDKLGLDRDQIGILQRDKVEIEDKQLVIGLMPSLARREYDAEVYKSFGLVIVDECHKLSTEYFADVLPKFSAKYRIGLSATITRKDKSDIVLYAHLGPIRVKAETKVMPLKIYQKKYYAKRKLYGKDERTRMACLARDPDRNLMMAQELVSLYKSGRNVVAVSSSVKHLETIIALCKELGIPEYDIGLLCANRSKYDAQNWNRIGTRKSTEAELKHAKEARICFMVDAFKEGIDVPKWDFLYELLPFWNANQRCGRVRRYVPNKLYPKCRTIRDMKCEFSKKMWEARLADYLACGAEIVEG